jgi:hypothetical protein
VIRERKGLAVLSGRSDHPDLRVHVVSRVSPDLAVLLVHKVRAGKWVMRVRRDLRVCRGLKGKKATSGPRVRRV